MDIKGQESKSKFYQSAGRNIFLNQEFFKILDTFAKEDILSIPLKGIALIQGVYPDVSTRHIGDIDILVNARDIYKARYALESLGYSAPKALVNINKPYSMYLNSVPFSKSTEIPYFIHLHWHILNTTLPLFMYDIDIEDIWSEAVFEEYGQRKILMMAPKHLIVYLSIHAFNHSFDKESLFSDLNNSIDFYSGVLNWQDVVSVALAWGANIPLYCSLQAFYRLNRINIPEDCWRKIKPHKTSKLDEKIIISLSSASFDKHNLVYPLYLSMAGSFWRKCKFIFLSLFPPYKVMLKIYSVSIKPLAFLYYFKRALWALVQIVNLHKKIPS